MSLDIRREVPNLDVLRALAVLLVVIDHSAKFLGVPADQLNVMGATGVSLFFVHTCLVLMLSLERQQSGSRGTRGLAWMFYVRRFFRIYPLSIFFVLLVTVFSVPQRCIAGPFHIAFQGSGIGEILSNAALTMNLTGHTPIIGQLWSLPLEVQMYILLPAAFLLSRRFGPWGVLICWGVSAGAASAYAAVSIPGAWRFSLLEYIPRFLPGVIAYSLWRVRPRIRAACWLPVLLLLCAAYNVTATPIACWLMCLGVGLAAPFFHQITARWLITPAHFLAKYSYGLYLGHVLALWIGFNAFHGWFSLQIVVWLAALVAIPVAAYHLIESPGMSLGTRLLKTRGQAARRQTISAAA